MWLWHSAAARWFLHQAKLWIACSKGTTLFFPLVLSLQTREISGVIRLKLLHTPCSSLPKVLWVSPLSSIGWSLHAFGCPRGPQATVCFSLSSIFLSIAGGSVQQLSKLTLPDQDQSPWIPPSALPGASLETQLGHQLFPLLETWWWDLRLQFQIPLVLENLAENSLHTLQWPVSQLGGWDVPL